MKIEVWKSDDSFTVVRNNDVNKMDVIDKDSELVKTIVGKNWDDCMIKYHQYMGWEDYIKDENKSV